MLSKVEAGKKVGEDSTNGKWLNHIEAISKALYLNKKPSRNSISAPANRSKPTGKTHLPDSKSKLNKQGYEDSSQKDKKSFWNWRPLKAPSIIRNHRFNCCFSLQAHSIEGLPSCFDNVCLCVHSKRRDGEAVTHPAKVFQGMVKFEEKLTHMCSVYGSRSGPRSSAKYEAKHFLLYASVFSALELDLGKHRIDLTRLLPLTLEELEEEKSLGKWTTSFKLSGKAKGAKMNVSFGYSVIGDNPTAPRNHENDVSTIQCAGSLPSKNKWSHAKSRSVEEIKDLHEILPTSRSELPSPVYILYQKSDNGKLDASVDYRPELDVFTERLKPTNPNSEPVSNSDKENVENECEDNEFSVMEQGLEFSLKEEVKVEEFTTEVAEASPLECPNVEIDTGVPVTLEEGTMFHPQDEENDIHTDEFAVHDCISKEDGMYIKEPLMKEVVSVLNNVSNLETVALVSPDDHEIYMEVKLNYENNLKGKSLSLDYVTEPVASEFLDMLGIEHSPFGLTSESESESPRERLLRQFEKETLAGGCSLFDFDMGDGDQTDGVYNDPTGSEWGLFECSELSAVIQAAEEEHQISTQGKTSRTRAKILEDLETEALMREWGLNEKAFRCSPPKRSGGFGSPIDLLPEEPLELPPLGEGLGPYLQTENGGFLRSMNPSLFQNANSGGSLIMQVSSPVVVPAEMGSGVMDILQRLALVGIEKLSMQANKLMPLEDITGKTMQQLSRETVLTLEAPERNCLLQHELEVDHDSSFGHHRVKGGSSGAKSNTSSSRSIGSERGSEYVSLEDLAPLATDKIEALSIEGLRIQSGMSDEDAPSNISAQSIGEISALQGKGVNISGSLGLEGTAGLQLLDVKSSGDDVDGLMSLSLTLDEWMRLDSGEIDDEDQISERTSKILAAHHANSLEMIHGGSNGEKRRGKGSSRKCGLLGNNFTVALLVQLRDPLRNYEPVGAPMLSLIQVERVFVPPKANIYSTVSEVRSSNEQDIFTALFQR